jgi:hypothetical protein
MPWWYVLRGTQGLLQGMISHVMGACHAAHAPRSQQCHCTECQHIIYLVLTICQIQLSVHQVSLM